MTDRERLELMILDYNAELEGDEEPMTEADMIEQLGRKLDTRLLEIDS